MITYRNERWYELTGLRAGHGDRLAGLRPPGRCGRDRRSLGRSAPARTPLDAEYRIRLADGTYRWFLGRALPTPRRLGRHRRPISRTASSPRSDRRSSPRPAGCSGARSTTSRRSPTSPGLRCRASPTGARSTSSSTDSSQRLALEHADPLKLALARELEEPMLSAVAVATRTTEPVLVTEIDERALASFRFNDDQLEIARTLAPRSYVTVPLTARGEVFGSVTLVTAESGRVYGDEDAALAQELARHAAAAIDNARLYAEVERRSRAARALEAVGDGVVLVDRDGVIRLWNTAATTITGVSEAETLGRRIEDVVHRWSEIAPLIPVASQPGEPVARRDRPGRVRRPRALDLRLGRGLRGRHRLRLPRPDRGEGARGDEGRLRRDRLARAADAAGRDLRLCADDSAHRHRARPGDPRPAARRDRLRVGPARDDRQRPPRRRPARRRPAARHGRAVRSGRGRDDRPRGRAHAPARERRARPRRAGRGSRA